MAVVARIGEVDAPLPVNDEVVRRIQRTAVEESGQDRTPAGCHVRTDDAPAAEIRPERADQTSVRIEPVAVVHPTRRTEHRGLARTWIEPPDVPSLPACLRGDGDIAEVDGPIGGSGGSL